MDAKKFLKEKGISNSDFMDSGVADLIETLLTEYHTLQLQQTGVMRSACKHDEENDTKAYAKNGNEFIGYYCEKCDSVYCGSI